MEIGANPIPRKLVEAVFRRIWIAAIPVVVAPLVVIAFVDHPIVYESSASAWVSSLGEALSAAPPTARRDPEDTAATRQVAVLHDLLATLSFQQAVALNAGLFLAWDSPARRESASYSAGSRIAVAAAGPNLVTIKASAPTALEAQRLVQGVMNQYLARASADRVAENAVVLGYFENALASAQRDLAGARADVAAYIKLNPLTEKTPTTESLRLGDRVDAAQILVDRLVRSQQDALLSAAASNNPGEAAFVVQDAASLPQAPLGIPLAKRAGYPLAGLMFGVILAVAYLYACYRSDHTVRTAADLARLDVSLLGEVPRLKPSGGFARFLRRDYARRVAVSLSARTPDQRLLS